jgi:hypothetical protein
MNSFVKSLLNVILRGLSTPFLDGHVIYRYDISGYRGLAVDQQGHAYICGRDSDDIHRLSPDGTFRDIVLSKHDGVDKPRSITFNNDFTKLFIINNGGKTVLVYRNVILRGLSTPSCLLNTISRNVPSGDNLCMSCESRPLMYT